MDKPGFAKSSFTRLAALAMITAMTSPIEMVWSGFRERFVNSFGRGRARVRDRGPRNPAGAKLIRGFYRNKFGIKKDYETARAWHASGQR